jgi:hypothetical protein
MYHSPPVTPKRASPTISCFARLTLATASPDRGHASLATRHALNMHNLVSYTGGGKFYPQQCRCKHCFAAKGAARELNLAAVPHSSSLYVLQLLGPQGEATASAIGANTAHFPMSLAHSYRIDFANGDAPNSADNERTNASSSTRNSRQWKFTGSPPIKPSRRLLNKRSLTAFRSRQLGSVFL